jgi:PPOX class probable F420-dependent enzyme
MADPDETVRRIEELVAASRGLVVFSTVRPSGAAHSTVVSAGILPHPVDGRPVVAVVAMGDSRKLRHLSRDPRATVVFRDGSRWVAVEGAVTVIGPDNPHPAVRPADLPALLREVYRRAGGGEHPDWAEYDAAMRDTRRALVLVSLDRTYGVYF